jgi:hypothetical protein
MKSIIRIGTAAAALAAALTMAPAAYSADEVVKITPDTKTVGVYKGETVKFIDAQTGKNFDYTFDTYMPTVDLNQVAPDGALGSQHVTAYVWDEVGDAAG